MPHAEQTSESVFIRARALLRLNKPQEAATWLQSMQELHCGKDAPATHNMLLGMAFSQIEGTQSASLLFERALSENPHSTIITEIAYCSALGLWAEKQYKAARKILEPVATSNHDIVSARITSLLGFIAFSERRFADGHTYFTGALIELRNCVAADTHLEATILHQLAIGTAEIHLCNPKQIDQDAHALPWTENMIMQQVQTLRHIGLAYERIGEHQRAIERFIEAADIRPKSTWAIIGYAEAANLCYRLNELTGAAAFLKIARDIEAKHADWQSINDESRIGLLLLATATAHAGNGRQAQTYFTTYNQKAKTKNRLPILSALHGDKRLENFENHTKGLVHAILGKPDAATILNEVANQWRRIEYRFRAEEAKRDIRMATHRSYKYRSVDNAKTAMTVRNRSQELEISANYLKQRDPKIHRPAKTVTVESTALELKTITLTKQQDRIVRLLFLGKTTKDIAADLSLQPKTVRNNLSRIYNAFGVTKQSQLIAKISSDESLRKNFAA